MLQKYLYKDKTNDCKTIEEKESKNTCKWTENLFLYLAGVDCRYMLIVYCVIMLRHDVASFDVTLNCKISGSSKPNAAWE